MKIKITKPKQTISGPNKLTLYLDADEVFPANPGMGTPALVENEDQETATFDCALDTGECGDGVLNDAECKWLHAICHEVWEWLDFWTEYKTNNS